MAKQYKEKEVISILQNKIKKGEVLFMPNCGSGLTARMQEEGGADIIMVSATSAWRLMGQGSLAALMPYHDLNQTIIDLAPQIMANVIEAPVLAGTAATNPFLPSKKHLETLWELGFSGINPFMINIYGQEVMEQMENIGMGWDRELDLVKTAHEMEMFCLEYAFTPEEARKIAEVGCPAISSHVGSTVGGARGAKTAITLDDAVRISQEIFDAARDVNPDIILFAHGGPMKGPKEVQYVLDNTNAQGFIGGSAAERMPIEKAVRAATQEYKALKPKN